MFKLTTLQFDSHEALLKAVRVHTHQSGVEWLAEGAYAVVYSLAQNPNEVMKVSGGDDQGYLNFLKTMDTLAISNPYLPVIHEAIHFRLTDALRKENGMWQHKERIVTYMEKLSQPPKLIRRDYDKHGHLVRTSWPPVKTWASWVSNYVHGDVRHIKELKLVHQELIVLLKIALEFHTAEVEKFKGYGKLDLHAGNVMCRGKQFVVTDPFA